MNDEDYELLQRKIFRTKKDLKRWESVFTEKHNRPPTVKDISERPNIEKFYKKYNQLKRELKQANEMRALEKHIGSPHRHQESIEFVRSPHRSSPTQRGMISSQHSVTSLSEFEDMKNSFVGTTTATTTATTTTNLAEDEAFWLGVSTHEKSSSNSSVSSSSQASPVSQQSLAQPYASSSTGTTTSTGSQTQSSQPRLILGGSQTQKKKKKSALLREQELLGRHTFHRRHLHHFQQKAEEEQQQQQQQQQQIKTTSHIPVQPENGDDDDMEGIEIVNHVVDPFRHYDPSVFHWEDPSFSIGPGFFGAATKVTMMLDDPSRRDRVLRKLEKGTLGEVLEENQAMEDEMEEEIRQFITQHHILDHPIPSEATTDDKKQFVYKKKPLQKRQTRLYKLKFVETR
ncbi:hypothetical protein BD560DRAFT_448503 [Blakeslea trispora]|nr:hypothetical protein BD560DRAFT_448503 [Blakeslea trispora]